MKLINGVFLGILFLTLLAIPVYAIPSPPNAFYGAVISDGKPVPDGTVVSARINGIEYASTTTTGGQYGIEPWFNVPADDPDTAEKEGGVNGEIITFYVGGIKANQEATFQWGARVRLDLTVTGPLTPSPTGSSGGGGGGGGGSGSVSPTPSATQFITVKIVISGKPISFPIRSDGEITEEIKVTTDDGKVTLTLGKGTIARDSAGKALQQIEVNINPDPPQAPAGMLLLGNVYSFGPDGARFNPGLKLEFRYSLYGGIKARNLILVYYDIATGQWVPVQSQIDEQNNKIITEVTHFTDYAILAPRSDTTTGTINSPSPSAVMSPTPAPGSTTPQPSISPQTSNVSPTQTQALENQREQLNPALIGGIIGGVLVVVLLVLLFRSRSRK